MTTKEKWIQQESDLARQKATAPKLRYEERDYSIRVYTKSPDHFPNDWSGSSFAGREWSGARWGGGRER